jgi:hypothetical protein
MKQRARNQKYGTIEALHIDQYLASLMGNRHVCGSMPYGLVLCSLLNTPMGSSHRQDLGPAVTNPADPWKNSIRRNTIQGSAAEKANSR